LEFVPVPLLADNALTHILDPIVSALHQLLTWLAQHLGNYGWSLVALAAIVKIAFWPLNSMQFKSMLKMQALQPKVKAIQQRHKGDREKLNEETMKLYKESGTNPLAGCAPLLLQMPILFSLYWAVIADKALFSKQTWLWIGSAFSINSPLHVLAANLAQPDYVLLAVYIVSMYVSIRFTSPAMDEQQAKQQRMMALISPVMIGYLGFQYKWPSALILYWLSFNVFSIAQQLYLINRYHRNPAPIGPHPERVLAGPAASDGQATKPAAAQKPDPSLAENGASGSRRRRRRRSKR
jgi:YidC/Oxa1 family membrane protein insertase